MAGEPHGVYIHIPFCRARCRYCDFNTYSGLEKLIPQYVGALLREMEGWRALSLQSTSVYFGGGTPSLLSAKNVQLILNACRDSFSIAGEAEIILEANPGTLAPAFLESIRKCGVNRLSLGVQSFDDEMLKMLGRLHEASEARGAYIEARSAGFDNISVDLMYGLPSQTLKQWEDGLGEAVELGPEHLSLYALTLEEHAPLFMDISSNLIPAPDPDLAADMYSLAENVLEKAGYVHYEISNWARPGRESTHNLTYWQAGSYTGIGAGAHSYFKGERCWNVAHPLEYIRRIEEQGKAILGRELISPETERTDHIILRLRLVEGLDLQEFRKRYGSDMDRLYGDEISALKEAGLLECAGGKLRLTPRGRLLGNEVFQRFLPKS